MKKELYGRVGNEEVFCYTLSEKDIEVDVLSYGGIIADIRVPDKMGRMTSVVLKKRSLAEYRSDTAYVGALIGRYANRIAGGGFTLNGKPYPLTKNEGENTLHGGKEGFHRKNLKETAFTERSVTLLFDSPDGEEGFPGHLTGSVTYALSPSALSIEYRAVCDSDTFISLTNHTYLNPNGEGSLTEGLLLSINADSYTPVDGHLIPTGRIRSVENTPFDFREERPFLGDLSGDEALKARGCYDENFVLRGEGLREAATLYSKGNGIRATLFTDRPGLQIYTGNSHGVALEPQAFPNACNEPSFPTPLLQAGEKYQALTHYVFSVCQSQAGIKKKGEKA